MHSKTCNVMMPPELLEVLDGVVKKREFENKSQAVRYAIRYTFLGKGRKHDTN